MPSAPRRLADVEDAARNLIADHHDVSRESIQLDVQLEAGEDHYPRRSRPPSEA
jgi:hypothetical protein